MATRVPGAGLPPDCAVLTVDVHNVQTHLGLFVEDRLVDDWWTETQADATADVLAADLAGRLSLRGLELTAIGGAIVSSTVPRLNRVWTEMAEERLDEPMLAMGPGLRTGMPIRIEHPGELGANRLVNAVAVYERFRRASIVVDFSTAIAFDVVSGDGGYLGSVFTPGLDISFDKLIESAAGLPSTVLERPGSPIGQSTVDAMHAGTIYGAAGLCDGLIERIRDEMEDEPAVLATGPRAPLVTEYCETIHEVDQTLTLEGLRIIYARNSGS